jgi:hypothetical protein
LLDDVVANFLESVTEREFDAPFAALLRAFGYQKIHVTHGQYEFGKDLIAQLEAPTRQFVFQTKAGDVNGPEWMTMRGQIDVLRTNDLAHPDFDRTIARVPVLVLTGHLVGAAQLETQNYRDYVRGRGEPDLEIWDRDRLIEMLTAAPEAGLTGFTDGPLLELLGQIDQSKVNEARLERFSERWIGGGTTGSEWRPVLEAAIIANRFRIQQRLDLACFTSLTLLRGVWASAHGAAPPPTETLVRRDMALTMFRAYALELWQTLSTQELTPRELISDDIGVFVTYPVRCSRVLEILGLYGLFTDDESPAVGSWLQQFLVAQPGAAHPISDRWAVSLLPAVILIARFDRAALRSYLTDVLKWLGDKHDGGGLGLAPPHAEPLEEVTFLLGSSLDYVDREPRKHSYLAGVLLDLAAVLEDAQFYDLTMNELQAVDVRPFVTIPRDDVDQYMATGHGIDVPINTSPNYQLEFSLGTNWCMASHHDADLSQYHLGRLGFLVDHLAISVVTRDRHWVAALRALSEPNPAP